MPRVVVGKWGKNLAVRLPLEIAAAAGLAEGAQVEMEAEKGEIVIRPISQHLPIECIFHGKQPAEWRRLYAEAFDWGPDRGRESIAE